MATAMNRDLVIALGHQIYATLELAMLVNKSDAEFAAEVIGPLSSALEYVREITQTGNN